MRQSADVQSSKFGLIVAVFTLGSMTGALSGSPITSAIGRIATLRLGAAICCLASIYFAITNSPIAMIISRFVSSSWFPESTSANK
jgi:predicted MFS family arabinose efflux permease